MAKKAAKVGKKSGAATKRKAPAKKKFVRAKHAGTLAPKANKAAGDKMYAERSDKGAPASVAIDRLPEPHRSVARAADALIRRVVPGASGVVKWGNAVYATAGEGGSAGQSFATIYQTKAGVNLGIPGVMLKDPEKLLEGTGKTMRHIKLKDIATVQRAAVADLVRQAAEVGMPGM